MSAPTKKPWTKQYNLQLAAIMLVLGRPIAFVRYITGLTYTEMVRKGLIIRIIRPAGHFIVSPSLMKAARGQKF
jgi:hypothetical protein